MKKKDKEILDKAVGIAIKNGLTKEDYPNSEWYVSVIFNRSFAKALFGEEEKKTFLFKTNPPIFDAREDLAVGEEVTWERYKLPAWQYHLQRMVIEPEPLKYLERFLEET